jgi:hypothetical protein
MSAEKFKTCSVCKVFKPLKDFYTVGHRCKSCRISYQLKRYHADPEPRIREVLAGRARRREAGQLMLEIETPPPVRAVAA